MVKIFSGCHNSIVPDGVCGEEEYEAAPVGVGLCLGESALVGGEEGQEADQYHSLVGLHSDGSIPSPRLSIDERKWAKCVVELVEQCELTN